MSNSAILLGYSGHGYVVAEAAKRSGIELIGYADQKPNSTNPFGLMFLGNELNTEFNWMSSQFYILGVGSNRIRESMFERVSAKGAECLTVIHPKASFSTDLLIGSGSFVARNVAINPLVQVGRGVILNTSCSIDHECSVGDFSHIAPGVVLAGNVKVGKSVFIGANSVIKEGVIIGDGTLIGAGSVVLKDVPSGAKMAGNPVRKI